MIAQCYICGDYWEYSKMTYTNGELVCPECKEKLEKR